MLGFPSNNSELYESTIAANNGFNRTMNTASVVLGGLAAIDFELAPDDRITFSVLPAVSSLTLQFAKVAINRLNSHLQDKILELEFPIEEQE